MKTALITGITGQDGSYLAELLLSKSYKVYGMIRRTSKPNLSRISHIINDIKLIEGDLTDQYSILECIKTSMPDEVYNLGAMSNVPTSWKEPDFTLQVTGVGVARILNAIKYVKPDIKFYQASSSEMFGKVVETPQTEKTPFYPRSPYGIAKLLGHWMTVNFRESYNMFCCSGILFNHESARRGIEFVTKKITSTIANIIKGKENCLYLGNINAMRDWGYAGDYVEAMWLMLQQDKPDDYIIATGVNYSIRKFVELAFEYVGVNIEWDGNGAFEIGIDKKTSNILVKINPEFYRPAEVDTLCGDPKKAWDKLRWYSKTTINELVKMMIEHDLNNEEV